MTITIENKKKQVSQSSNPVNDIQPNNFDIFY